MGVEKSYKVVLLDEVVYSVSDTLDDYVMDEVCSLA